ncbi:MAG TPA: hypothetical protein PLX41_08760 [Bacteroidales bacterium]|nr:hypothetical protein [Bacteroidales bacterium]
MKRFVVFLIFLFSAVLSFPVHTATVNTSDTRMMSQAAVSDGSIAFIYAEDMWTAGIDGSNPRRLTIDEGVESNPHFSPDGKTIAFSAQENPPEEPVRPPYPVRVKK